MNSSESNAERGRLGVPGEDLQQTDGDIDLGKTGGAFLELELVTSFG